MSKTVLAALEACPLSALRKFSRTLREDAAESHETADMYAGRVRRGSDYEKAARDDERANARVYGALADLVDAAYRKRLGR